ncbi:MAG: T9SS type A sorting domain-containing protein [Candidatus Eisenbacteria bacterium]|uniref:T9SS type A sorting domain-containing protein n=1 Tax=Eiseniibacteriota bacterium TaxID=2212470 RepID=A0A9D6L7B3_UNCEI|nr:T9SS type A sorting domain-containing protein [Candidatus Eisenbacteria bacterium]
MCGAYSEGWFPRVCADEAGGAFITWQDYRLGNSNPDIYAQHVTGAGAIASGWPVDGLLINGAAGEQTFPDIAGDGAGGAIIVWRDGIGALYAQRITTAGAVATGWPASGVVVCPAPGWQDIPHVVPDGAGGAIVGWEDARTAPPGTFDPSYDYSNIYAQHVTASGTISTGWPADGLPVCLALHTQHHLSIAADGVGGVLMAWEDYRAGYAQCFTQPVNGDGTVPVGWPENGLLVSTLVAYQLLPKIAPDGAGGAYVSYYCIVGDYDKLYAQHLTGAGLLAPGWIASGTPLASTNGEQIYPSIVGDGRGGAIVAWEDARDIYYLIYAQRLVPDGPVAVALSLVSAEAEPNEVRLKWHAADGARITARVERRTGSTTFDALGTIVADGTGALEYVDKTVTPGARYAYRLRYRDGATEALSAEAWVDVPRTMEFALEGLRPNPAVGTLTAAFSLAGDSPATLELIDISGRRIHSREVGSLGAGRHVVRLNDGALIAPGIYWMRLTQSGQSLLARGVVVK